MIRGNYIPAIQGEYRWNFVDRWGAVCFFGFASVFESINTEDDGRLLPGVGFGFRYTAFTDNHMNVGLDIATGRNDWGIYFRIGEAFWMLDAGCWMLDAGCWMLDAGCWMLKKINPSLIDFTTGIFAKIYKK